MKAAIIGGGFAGEIHASALRSCGIDLSAVVTTRADSAKNFAQKWQIPRWGTDSLIALDDDIDTVHICTPPSSHGRYIREALAAGKKVFCEKPLCFDFEEAYDLAAALQNSGINGTVSFNVRYHMAVQRARELILSGAFGRPLLIHGSYLQEFHILPCPYGWRYDTDLGGKMRAVTEIGSHWIDTAQYISGKQVKAVSASLVHFFPDRIVQNGQMKRARIKDAETAELSADIRRIRVESEDAACISFRYEDGAIGNVFLSEISHGRGNHLSLEVTCENGSLWWNEEENNVLHTAVRGEGVRSEIFAFGNGFQDTFISLIRNFYEEKEYPTFFEAAWNVGVCDAIARSASMDSMWTEVKPIPAGVAHVTLPRIKQK